MRAAWSDQPLAAVQADFPPSVDGPEALSPSPLSAGPVEPPSAPRRRFGLASLGRVRALMRECVEEAIGTLQSRSVSLDDDEEDEAGETGAGSALDASARVANSPGWSLQATAPEPDQTDLPPQASWTRSRAAAISAGLAGAPSASSGPPAPAPAALADLRSWLPSAGDNGRRAS
ncbi:MAG: hypothetical protein VKK62_07935 [Synechococcaceae cyanobacterium]|nr:hypothetical protein [Synechococcaceae cyanobacterium]